MRGGADQIAGPTFVSTLTRHADAHRVVRRTELDHVDAGDVEDRLKVLDSFALFDHHLCHAASAFYTSDFSRSLVLTLDFGSHGAAGELLGDHQ